MSRYINMVDVITYPVMPVEYRKYQTMNLDDAYEQGWYDLQNLIEKMPTADVRENVHGEWETDSDNLPFCSKCGEIALQRVFVKVPHLIQDVRMVRSNFCPNCGALMSESLKLAEVGKAIAEGLNEGLNAEIHPSDRISGE